MKVTVENNTYTFVPEVRDNIRLKGTLAGRSLGFIIPGAITLFSSAFMYQSEVIPAMVLSVTGIIGIWAGVRYAQKAIDNEQLVLNADALTLTSLHTTKTYLLSNITSIHYTGYAPMTDHPLKTGGFDYLGFETREKEIARLVDEGHIKFIYDNKAIWFGKELASWDAQQISEVLGRLTDGRLIIQDLPEDIPEDIYMHNTAQ